MRTMARASAQASQRNQSERPRNIGDGEAGGGAAVTASAATPSRHCPRRGASPSRREERAIRLREPRHASRLREVPGGGRGHPPAGGCAAPEATGRPLPAPPSGRQPTPSAEVSQGRARVACRGGGRDRRTKWERAALRHTVARRLPSSAQPTPLPRRWKRVFRVVRSQGEREHPRTEPALAAPVPGCPTSARSWVPHGPRLPSSRRHERCCSFVCSR